MGLHPVLCLSFFRFFVKQKTAYEMRISDWSSDVCSSDLLPDPVVLPPFPLPGGDACGADMDVVRRVGITPVLLQVQDDAVDRSEERRVGKECVSTCRSRWSPYH